MPLLCWKPEYSINDALLDKHHQNLFILFNTAYECVMNSAETDCVLPIIDELMDYTRYHFSAEEQYLRERGVPELDDHIAKHRELSDKIETLRTRYHDNNLEVAKELIVVLGDWLLSHVLKDDRQYAGLSTAVRA
jgi:hemerythrin